MSYFDTEVNIIGNSKLREPQKEAYIKIKEYFDDNPSGEALVVLPTGTGKSGLISIAPFGVAKKRVLIITPGLVTKKSVIKTLHPLEDNFWINYDVLFDFDDIPVVEEYDTEMLNSSLEKCNFVITNIHKLQECRENSLLNRVSPDFFDMVIVDEAHHAPAGTWEKALSYFSKAKKLHVTGTPYRGDGEPLPGEKIHETPLSEVMALKYVKFLRNVTINNANLFFTISGDERKYTKDEIIEYKESEWIEKSVALSSACSKEVINKSIEKLDELRKLSPNVPHKILAVGCSINHANDLAQWYIEAGKKVVIIHSAMNIALQQEALLAVENNLCDVVVSVNMLMEGYDHKYLTVLAIFRPYRSQNAFAQIIGRVLRAIPDNEITQFEIDNNAIVIYHEELGLNTMWATFQDEVNKSQRLPVKEHEISDGEYKKREILYANVEVGDSYISSQSSFIDGLDFNKMFEDARNQINDEVDKIIQTLSATGMNPKDIEDIKTTLLKRRTNERKGSLNEIMLSKRPEQLRIKTRDILYKDANEAAQTLLAEKGIDPKANNLYNRFRNFGIYGLSPDKTNDAIIVMYINRKLYNKYGPVKKRESEALLASQKYMMEIIDELRRTL